MKVGSHVRREAPEKIVVIMPLLFFGSTSTIIRFVERIRDGQFLFSCSSGHDARRAQPFIKVGAPAPFHMESAPLARL